MGTNITGIGVGIGIPFRNNAHGGDKPYLPPEIKDSLKAIVIAYGKTNEDSDRSIVKNLVDPDNPFIISNAAYKLNSGYGKYEEDFTTWVGAAISINNGAGFKIERNNTGWWGFSTYGVKATNEFKIKVTNCRDAFSWRYKDAEGIWQTMNITKDGIYTLPASQERDEHDAPRFFNGNPNATYNGLTVEQIPSFEGAFVTDGINDLITSTKTVQEMLGGSNEITVVSMMANLDSVQMMCNSNYNNTNGYNPRNTLEPNGVISMLGYTDKNGTTNNLNLIMGDKDSIKLVDEVNFNSDYVFYPAQYYGSYYKAAWYWTVIANKVLTTDQINQVIAYFNLDRTLKPDILCNTIKQGITNENHAEFGDKLIDFSGNGRDIQLNNIAWKWDSGIGKYVEDFTTWYGATGVLQTFSKIEVTDGFKHNWVINRRSGESAINSFKVLIKGIPENGYIQYRYFESEDATKKSSIDIYEDGEYSLPNSTLNNLNDLVGFQLFVKIPPLDSQSFIGLTITQIPSHAGALCLDGVNDFGKVTGMPIYKDYTVIADYIRISAKENVQDAPILSKSKEGGDGAFIFNYVDYSTSKTLAYSFANINNVSYINDFERNIYYQSKYTNNGNSINAGTGVDTNSMWLGTYRDNVQNYFTGAIYSLMTFPYSMSEFLIERQLKKHKLGTLYPDMVEFRPVIKANANYKITYYQIDSTNTWKSIKVGDYIVIGAKLAFQITFDNDASELKEVVSPQLSGIIVEKRPSNPGYNIYSYITSKSPQKINITIDEYIRFEDIVQPYPVLLRFKDENGNEVSWGGKFKVGSTITRIGSAADSNLLPNIYNIFGLLLNGNQVTSSKVIVEKTMVFKAKSAYIFDNNEPKCILSPRLLRIPNSSYKILGHIPDISGHGNHGKINNSAYAGMSGANGYVENFTTWGVYNGAILTDNTIKTNSNFNPANSWVAYKGANTILNSFSVNITGIPEGGILNFRVNADTFIELSNGRNDLSFDNILITVSSGFRITKGSNLDWSNLVIQQIGEYEGAYCLDGVDDFVTIPTLSSRGKQVLMKVNWNSLNHVLYDQRNNAEAPFCIVTASGSIAYNQRNVGGNTYIDGILNNHILVADLQAITHNIVLNNDYNVANSNSFIGTNYTKSIYAKMSLYDFMLFDEISTDDKIKELNEYVGIEGNTE